MKNINDFKIGEYYYSELITSGNFFITKCESIYDSSRLKGWFISNMNNKKFEFAYSTPLVINNNDRKTRIATHKERKWLNECIKANKFIPFNKLKIEQYYEIY